MTAIRATLKVSAVLAYEDGTSRQILASLDENGSIAVNDSELHTETASDLDNETDSINYLEFYNLDDAVTYTFTASIADTNEKTPTSAVLEVTGRTAMLDNTYGDFYYLFDSNESSNPQRHSGHDYFAAAMENDTLAIRFIATVATSGFVLNIT